jgi:hypothetical protein
MENQLSYHLIGNSAILLIFHHQIIKSPNYQINRNFLILNGKFIRFV